MNSSLLTLFHGQGDRRLLQISKESYGSNRDLND